jgi:hypothetical protein
MRRGFVLFLFGLAVAVLISSVGVGSAAAGAPQTCSGTPGVLAGSYSNVFVTGQCVVAGPTTVNGNLTLQPGSALLTSADLTVTGNVIVLSGATLIGGQESDAPTAQPGGTFDVSGNLIASQPLGVVVHGASIDGNVEEAGGGGGFNCEPTGVFTLLDSPVFSVLEGSHVGGNVRITGLTSCWLGITHSQIDGSVHLIGNQLADPDAVEVLDNAIGGSIVCQQNSMMWDSADITEELYPRVWEPNTVGGTRVGQCVIAAALTQGGASPGPF